MKNRITLLLCLTSFYLLFAPKTQAQDYTAQCASAPNWVSGNATSGGGFVKRFGSLYQANYWTNTSDPATNNGPASSGQPWTLVSYCESAPTISITAPADNAIFTAPTTVSIQTNASAYGSYTISKVEFYAGTTKLAEVTTAPYTYNWAAPSGEYDLTARIYDSRNAVVTSAAKHILVKLSAPDCSVPTWDPALNYNSGTAQVWYEGQVYKQRDGFPYAPAGTNPATNSEAYQHWELVGICALHPSANVTSPANNDAFAEASSITITANATDREADIDQVEFYSGSTLLGSDATAPYSITWNSATAGSHNITAKAVDQVGLSGTSAPVTLVVGSSSFGPLPVTFASFRAIPEKNKILLQWSTASETDNKGFEVMRSADGENFKTIAFVAGWGNSKSVRNYNTSDKAPLSGAAYYRLKQIDFSGKASYSKIISVNHAAVAVQVLPNPVQEKLQIRLNLQQQEPVTVCLLDHTGRSVYRKLLGVSEQPEMMVDMQTFKPGVYLLTIRNQSQLLYQEKIVKE